MNFKLILILILSSLAVIFIAQNIAMVDVSFFIWNFSIPSSLLMFLTLIFGCVLGWFLHSYIAYQKSKDVFEYLS